jgi:glycosyltransferase involved in cell wall biosynthesis
VRKGAEAVVVVCDFVGDILKGQGFSAQNITCIPNGIAIDRFNNVKEGTLRRQLGIEDNMRIVGTVANVRGSKGYEYYLHAARIVLDRFPNTLFVAAGDIDPALGSSLQDLHRRLNLGYGFRFLGFREDVPGILKDLDVFVLSSTSEGLPLVTLEAMASGKPIVVTRCGGPQEVVENGVNGFVVNPGDSNALAFAIGELLEKPERAQSFGRQARIKAESEFSIEAMVGHYEDLYLRMMERN